MIVEQWGGRAFNDVDQLINSGVDAVTIATPTVNHRSTAERLLAAGVACLIEKPLAPSAEEARAGGMNPQMFNSFLDGTKSALEMAAVANATGLACPDDGLAFPACGVDDLPDLLKPRSDGGVLAHRGQVEVVSSLERDGRRSIPAQEEVHVAHRFLRERDVDERRWRLTHPPVLRVGCDAHHGQPTDRGLLPRPEAPVFENLADGLLTRPHHLREPLVHDGGHRCAGHVCRVKRPAAANRQADGREVTG